MRSARIIGSGVGALFCARLLRDKGWTVSLRCPELTSSPALVLNAMTVQLIAQIFGHPEDIFEGAQRLDRRYVYWGADPIGIRNEEPGLVLRGDLLAARLRDALNGHAGQRDGDGSRTTEGIGAAPVGDDETRGDWTIYAPSGGRLQVGDGGPSAPQRFGDRCAIAANVRLRANVDRASSWIESTATGWLFLAPLGDDRAMLQAIVPVSSPDPDESLAQLVQKTKAIKDAIARITGPAQIFPCAPAYLKQVYGPCWLAAGSLACSYDPLCGDGTGYAIRIAILAAAVIDAVERGPAPESYLAYYGARLRDAFCGHLRACASFYGTGGFDRSWNAELQATVRGLRDLSLGLVPRPHLQFGLRGYDLISLQSATMSPS